MPDYLLAEGWIEAEDTSASGSCNSIQMGREPCGETRREAGSVLGVLLSAQQELTMLEPL